MVVQKILFFFSFVCACILSSSCQQVSKSFELLERHDYYSSYQGFHKHLKRDSSVCGYGLSLYYDSYIAKDLDSSLKYVLIAEKNWGSISKNKRAKWSSFGFDSSAIQIQKHIVGDQLFALCRKRNSVTCFDTIIEFQSWSRHLTEAIYIRDSLNYMSVKNSASRVLANEMIMSYPNSVFIDKLRASKDLFDYRYFVKNFTETELTTFINDFPLSTYYSTAQDSLFALYKRYEDYKQMDSFIKSFPMNRNVDNAWRELYRLYTNNYSPELLDAFNMDFPNYPFKSEFNLDSELADKMFYPFSDDSGRYGYTDSSGKWLINPQYDDASFFYDGLAVVEQNGKQGLINKKNQLVSGFVFDEIETDTELFVVTAGDKSGIIDRNGDFVFDLLYQDISILDEGFICAQKDSLYAFYDRSGVQLTSEIYDFVLNFKYGVCPVSIQGKRGLLNKDLRLIIPCKYEAIYTFTDSLFILVIGDNLRQLCNRRGELVNDSLYQEINEVANGYSICIRDSKIGYLDSKGHQIIENKFDVYPAYDLMARFLNGRAVVSYKGKFGVIDTAGQFMIKPKHELLINLGNYFGIKKNESWSIIDSQSKLATPIKFDNLDLIDEQYVLFKKEGKLGIMDLQLNELTDSLYSSIIYQRGFFIVKSEGQTGLIDDKGKQLVPFSEYMILNLNEDYFIITGMGEDFSYFNKESGIIIRKQ